MSKNNVIQVEMDQEAYEKYISGSGGSGGGDSNIEYLDISGLEIDPTYNVLISFADVVKAEDSGVKIIGLNYRATQLSIGSNPTIIAIGMSFDRLIHMYAGDQKMDSSLINLLKTLGSITDEQLAAIPRITKEQFYTL